jgi:hypothetical protein
MADFLISLLPPATGSKKARYTEIGTRNGDIFACVSHFAAPESTAIEGDKRACAALKERGIKHLCVDYETLTTPEKFPEAELYYFWSYPEESEHLLKHILQIERKRKRKGKGVKLVLNFDMQYIEDFKVRALIADAYGGDWSNKVFFDEGDTDRTFGAHWPGVFDLGEMVERAEADAGWWDAIKDEWVVPHKKNPELFDDEGKMLEQ